MFLVSLYTQTHSNAVMNVATAKLSAAPWWWWCRKPPDTLRCASCSVMAWGRGYDLFGDTACVWLLLLRRLCAVARRPRTDWRFQSAQRWKPKYSGGAETDCGNASLFRMWNSLEWILGLRGSLDMVQTTEGIVFFLVLFDFFLAVSPHFIYFLSSLSSITFPSAYSSFYREERIPIWCNNINDLLSIPDVDYWLQSRYVSGIFMPTVRRKVHVLLHMGFSW